MNRITRKFADLKAKNQSALIPFVTCGDPSIDTTLEVMHQMVENGADILELGVPFSDPMADGPVIQLANERSLEHNTSLSDVMALVTKFRESNTNTPVVLMGYLNPIEFMGYEKFVTMAKKSGVDGLITVDLPPEEAGKLGALLKEQDIATIYLITPTTSDERAKSILQNCQGYVYYVSLKGVTGSNQLNVEDVTNQVGKIRQMTNLPVAVGFGIRDAKTASQISVIADGVVVGSVLVNKIASLANESSQKIANEVSHIIKGMRESMDHASR